MRQKIDSVKGRLIYNRRLATVEPVFTNIRSTLGLDRFTLRGKKKVSIQWRLYCTVHNLLKVHTDMGMLKEEAGTNPNKGEQQEVYEHVLSG